MITPDEVDEEVQKEGRRDTAEQREQHKEEGERGKEERKVVVIVGATGSGKSELGVKVAKACNGEIISMDSMQVYVVSYLLPLPFFPPSPPSPLSPSLAFA